MTFRHCHFRSLGLLRAGAVLVFGLFPSAALTQSVPSQEPRITVALLVGASQHDVMMAECCALHTPPILVVLDESQSFTVLGGDARFYWTPRTSTFVAFEGSSEIRWQLTYPRPASILPVISTYVAERRGSHRNNTLTVGQSLELVTQARLRPWMFAALARHESFLCVLCVLCVD